MWGLLSQQHLEFENATIAREFRASRRRVSQSFAVRFQRFVPILATFSKSHRDSKSRYDFVVAATL